MKGDSNAEKTTIVVGSMRHKDQYVMIPQKKQLHARLWIETGCDIGQPRGQSGIFGRERWTALFATLAGDRHEWL